MTAFSTIDKAPGVYIQEVTVLGPIAGVATSTAAFVGPARRGALRTPVRLANWAEFVAAFGEPDDLGPYLTGPAVQVTPAVAGFFANGGADCWFVRVGTAEAASLTLADRSVAGAPTLVVTAKAEGAAGNAITVAVAAASTASTAATRADTTLAAASAAGANQVTVASAADADAYAVGDWVLVDDGANEDRAQVTDVNGAVLSFAAVLSSGYAANTPLRMADLAAGQKTIRVDDVTGLPPGAAITITQDAVTEGATVRAVDPAGHHLTLERALGQAFTMAAADTAVTVASEEFTITIGGTEHFTELSLDPRHPRFVLAVVDSAAVTVALADDPPNPTLPPENLPADLAATALAGGAEDDPTAITANDFKAGIDALRPVDEVNMLCVPDRTDQDVQAHMIEHCEALADRFAILDPMAGADSATIRAQRDLLASDGGYGALYYPRIVISDPRAPGRITVAPSGHVAGLYARVDDERGVFKAPANETLAAVLDLERMMADETQGPLNEHGINVIRSFPGRGAVVWGARTLSTATVWRYVNVRRLLEYIEESIVEGTQFVVFEPNTPALWAQVKRQITEFLTRQWTAGALVGATAADAFQVICDAALNPPASMALGQLVVEVRLYPAPPAEFVVFRIIQRPGGPEIQE